MCNTKVPTKGGLFASDLIFTMARDNKITLPSSGSGIVRYFDELKSKITIKPEVVIIIIAVVVILELILHLYGNSFFGVG